MGSKLYRKCFLLPFFLLISGLIPIAASATTSTFDIFQRDNTTDSTEPLNCTTESSTDYYGFGVRLGVYFAWLSSYFANILLPEEIAGSLDTNSIFLLALLASLFRGTLTGDIFQIDGLIIMHLSSGFLFSSLSIWGYRTSFYQKEGPKAIGNFGRWGTHCRLALVTSISLYGTWFWWEGLEDGLNIAQDPRCVKLYTWFFRQWPVSGGISIWYIVVSFSCAVYHGIMCIAAAIAGISKLFRVGWKGEMEFETGLTAREQSILYNVLRVFNLFWIIFCASMIEMTLNKNHMLNTLSQHGDIAYPAQLLPLIVGVLSFVRVLWLIYEEWKVSPPEGFKRNVRYTYHYFLDILWPPSKLDNQLDIHSPLRPWYRRYLMAWMPWLSTFSAWKTADSQRRSLDVELSPQTESRESYPVDEKKA